MQAAQKIGLAEVPTIDLSWLTPAQRQAYVIADNQLATDAGWDAEMLRLEQDELEQEGANPKALKSGWPGREWLLHRDTALADAAAQGAGLDGALQHLVASGEGAAVRHRQPQPQ